MLSDRAIDMAPATALAAELGVSERMVCATAVQSGCLGLCDGSALMVFCLPPQPLAAGFVAEQQDGRLVLRLPNHHHRNQCPDYGHRDAAYGDRSVLFLSGNVVGPVPPDEREHTVGSGELAHLISRLTLMSIGWLPQNGMDATRLLFELIAIGWRSGTPAQSQRWAGGELAVHHAEFPQPIARGLFGPTKRLELVTYYRDGSHQLVNVYPGLGQA